MLCSASELSYCFKHIINRHTNQTLFRNHHPFGLDTSLYCPHAGSSKLVIEYCSSILRTRRPVVAQQSPPRLPRSDCQWGWSAPALRQPPFSLYHTGRRPRGIPCKQAACWRPSRKYSSLMRSIKSWHFVTSALRASSRSAPSFNCASRPLFCSSHPLMASRSSSCWPFSFSTIPADAFEAWFASVTSFFKRGTVTVVTLSSSSITVRLATSARLCSYKVSTINFVVGMVESTSFSSTANSVCKWEAISKLVVNKEGSPTVLDGPSRPS